MNQQIRGKLTRQVPKHKAKQKPKNKENNNYNYNPITLLILINAHMPFLAIYTFLSLCPINPKGSKVELVKVCISHDVIDGPHCTYQISNSSNNEPSCQ